MIENNKSNESGVGGDKRNEEKNDEKKEEINEEKNDETNKSEDKKSDNMMNMTQVNQTLKSFDVPLDEPIPSIQMNIFNKIERYYKFFIFKTKFGKFLHKYILNRTDLLLLLNNITAIILYHISLMPCEKDPSECTIKHGMIFYVTIGVLTAISSVLYAIFISLTLYKLKHFIHYLYTVPVFCYFIMEYNGTETIDHGFYNACGWVGILLIFLPILLFTYKIIDLIRAKNYYIILSIFVVILILVIIYNNLSGFSCDYWDLGLNNTRIDNDKNIYPCKVLHPGKNKCYLRKMDGFFDFSKIFRPSCAAEDIIGKEKKIFLDSLSTKYFGVSNLNHFGYPMTTFSDKYSMYSVRDLKDFQDRINRNIIKMDLYNEHNYPNEPYPEVEVFFDENNYGNISINITRNETLSRERKEIAKNTHSLFDNVLVLYVDALSRNHFQRKIHKVSKYIEQFMPYNLNETEKPYTTFQFMKYNTLKGLTLPNIKSMFYGIHLEESNGVNVVKYFKKQGYVTGHTGTTCGKEIFSVNGLLQSQHLDYDSWDHENIAMFCDPNFFDARYPINKGVASVLKRCLYGKYGFEYMIEYTKQFWNLYPDNKKFFRIHFNEGHEGSMELVTYMADPFFEFVKYFFENNLLNDTFIFIVSDHGNHMVGPWAILRPNDYVIESTLATLFFIIPNNQKLYQDGLYDKIQKNQQIFVTPYDVHDTMVDIAYGTDEPDPLAFSKRGNSLLIDIDPMDRYCESPKLNLSIAKSDCKCKIYKDKFKAK